MRAPIKTDSPKVEKAPYVVTKDNVRVAGHLRKEGDPLELTPGQAKYETYITPAPVKTRASKGTAAPK